MVTWVEVGLDRGVTHHVKVITRSNLLMGENSLFLLQFCSLEMSSIMVETLIEPNTEEEQNIPRD